MTGKTNQDSAITMPARVAATFKAYPAATRVLEGMGCKNGNGYMTATFASTCGLTGRRIAYGEGIQKITFWNRDGSRFQGYIANATARALDFRFPRTVEYPKGHEFEGEDVPFEDQHESYSTFSRCGGEWWATLDANKHDVLEIVNWKPGALKSTTRSYRKVEGGWRRGDKFGVVWNASVQTDKQFASLLGRTKSNFAWRVFPGHPISEGA